MGAKQMKCLSSASPAHSPKEEYVITQSTDTTKEEPVHDQSEDQGEPQEGSSDLTERKPVTDEVLLCGLCPTLGHDGQEEEKTWEEQLDAHQEQLEKEMQEARRMVFRLQGLLLHGSLPEEDQDGSVNFGENRATTEQQLVVIRSRLDQSMEEALDLKRELLRHKQETRHIQAIKDALQQRLAVQEEAVLQLKQELLRSNMAKDELEGENEELKRKLSERNKLLCDYEQQFGRKDRLLQQHQQRLDEAQHKAHEVGHGRSFRSESGGYSNSVATSPPAFQHNPATGSGEKPQASFQQSSLVPPRGSQAVSRAERSSSHMSCLYNLQEVSDVCIILADFFLGLMEVLTFSPPYR
ncbi:dixin-A [Nematolebias whitei]|uniref:dixin-A n=1 Tax=Nematolebias whitei TaxID=451745 RepID=UPI001899442B|nr:dixin-A [Nematolebias whitei]